MRFQEPRAASKRRGDVAGDLDGGTCANQTVRVRDLPENAMGVTLIRAYGRAAPPHPAPLHSPDPFGHSDAMRPWLRTLAHSFCDCTRGRRALETFVCSQRM